MMEIYLKDGEELIVSKDSFCFLDSKEIFLNCILYFMESKH